MNRKLLAPILLLSAYASSFAATRAQCTAAGGTPTLDTDSSRPGFTGTFCAGGDEKVRDQAITDKRPHPVVKAPPGKRPVKE